MTRASKSFAVGFAGESCDDAERQARYAVEIDPLSVSAQFNLARVLFNAGKLDEAEATVRKVPELQPTASSSHRFQVLVAVERNDGEAASREANHEADENFHLFELALAHYIRGEHKEADAALADLCVTAHGVNLGDLIGQSICALDNAFRWLRTSFDQRDGGALSLLVDPLLRNLRGDPRYRSLVAKLGMPAR
jgi:tetratricopeptide (TPR) repeat protein